MAVERHPGRADALRRTAARMGADIVDVRTADAAEPRPTRRSTASWSTRRAAISGRSRRAPTRAGARPDGPPRWPDYRRASSPPERPPYRPGGTLVYSTCTISPTENEHVVTTFLESHDEFEADDLGIQVPVWKHPTMPQHLQTLPHRDRTDGFFIARLRRRA